MLVRVSTIACAAALALVGCDRARTDPASAKLDPSPTSTAEPTKEQDDKSAIELAEKPAARAPVRDLPFDTIAWRTGDETGNGVAFKDTTNGRGESAAIFYSGFGVPLEAAEAWASAFYRESLASRGVRYLWAVQGPADSLYRGKELGNASLAASLVEKVSAATNFIVVFGHSSGSYVAHDLFGKLGHGSDPDDVTDERIVYFDLDGGIDGYDGAIATRLRRTYFVASYAPEVATASPNIGEMQGGAAIFHQPYVQNDATGSGCAWGKEWCVHVTLVNTRPHDPNDAKPIDDYADFTERAVAHAFFDQKAAEAGLIP